MSLFGSFLSTPKKSTGGRLLERLSSSTQLEDRRDAIAEFKDLSSQQPLRLIDKGGFSVLASLLREEDTEMTRDTLETLSNLMDPQMPKEDPDAAGIKAVHNAGIFLANTAYLSTVTCAVENDDMYVKFHCVQLLIRLLSVARAETQQAVLSQPATVGRILQLMDEKREIVRNEVLLLLAQLGEANADLQNILAFQGANEQVRAACERVHCSLARVCISAHVVALSSLDTLIAPPAAAALDHRGRGRGERPRLRHRPRLPQDHAHAALGQRALLPRLR